MFVDSHAHLADPAFDADRDVVIDRARSAGARAIVCIGESIEAARRARDLAKSHSGLLAWTAGVHPHDAGAFDADTAIPRLRELIASGAVAVGECGLDYHYDHSPRDAQRRAFEAQLELAREVRRPAVVHTREAEDDTARMVGEAGRVGVVGVMHCFTGSHELARVALDAGWYISFSGIITFNRWDDDALLRLVPDDRVLVESDSPYLAPVPHRGRRNEPSFVPATIDRLAAARRAPTEAVMELTALNASRLFDLATD